MDEDAVVRLEVHLDPESGLYTAHLHGRHPMVVTAFRLAEVLAPVWAALSDAGYFQGWPSDVVVDLHHRQLREDNRRLAAEGRLFAVALSRIGEPGHPAGSAATLAEARDIAAGAFREASLAGRAGVAAARGGALAQTRDATERDLVLALRRAALDVLDAVGVDGGGAAEAAEGVRGALDRLRVAAEVAEAEMAGAG